MPLKREFARKFDETQSTLPYNECDDSEKALRRRLAIRLKLLEEERVKKGEKRILSDENIYKDIVGVPKSDFYRWFKQEKNEKGSGFSGYKRGPKQTGPKYLSKEQIDHLIFVITNKFPQDFNIPRCLWDRLAVAEYCKFKFQVSYSLHTISKILRDNGLVLRRPAKFSIKRNQEEIDEFTSTDYPSIVKEVEADGGILLHLDETHIQQDSNRCRGFSPVGLAPHLVHYAKTSSHSVGSLFICISMDGFMFHDFSEKTCNAEDFIWFLKQLSKKIRNRKIHILLDNAKIHHAKKVEKFLKRKRKFKLHFLPAYAPDLNAVELFNNALKSDIRHQKAMDSDELIDFVNQYMETKGNNEEFVKSFFESKTMQYTKVA